MKRTVCIILSMILILAAVPAAGAAEYDGALRTSRYCAQASMTEYRGLFAPVERAGLGTALTHAMTAHILYGMLASDSRAAATSEGLYAPAMT